MTDSGTNWGSRAPAARRGAWATALVLACSAVATTGWAEAGAKVELCHLPAGNQANWHTLTVGEQVVAVHLAHGDFEGGCAANCEALCDDGDACTIDCDPGTFDLEGCLEAPRPPVDCALPGTDAWCYPDDGCQYVEAECTNGLDDDGNGLVDCETATCTEECVNAGFDPSGCSDNDFLADGHTGAVCVAYGPDGIAYHGTLNGKPVRGGLYNPWCALLDVCFGPGPGDPWTEYGYDCLYDCLDACDNEVATYGYCNTNSQGSPTSDCHELCYACCGY